MDEAKASENYGKHGVSFESARTVFKDAFAVEELDDREDYGEAVHNCRHVREHSAVRGVYATRDTDPLISARRATRHEQDDYYQQNT